MRMKIVYIFTGIALITFILSINLVFVQAVDCSADTQTILKLSSASNAHGAIYSDAYPTSICYDTIFGSTYTGADPHTCSANNKVLRLSATTNAHAEGPLGTAYTTDVCYGNLQCTERTGICDTGESLVVALSATTNAHLSSDASFPQRICCKAASLSGAQWTNLNDAVITSAGLNDDVKLILTGTGLTGQNINFIIYKIVPFWTDTKVAQSDGKGFTIWKANEAGTYYFKAKVESTGQEVKSSLPDLVVTSNADNAPPIAGIDVPKHGAVYSIDPANGKALVFFNHISTDEDDDYSIKWVFGDGQEEEKLNCRINNCNTTHEYTTTKLKTIKLVVTDARGATSSVTRNILIVNPFSTLYPFPLVWNPLNDQYMSVQTVDFNATSSYAIKSDSGNLYCVAGNCPLQTSDALPKTINLDTTLNLNREVTNINFTWTIDGIFKRSKFGLDSANFSMLLPIQGKHTAKLQTFFEMAEQTPASDEVYINFTTGTAAGFCSSDRTAWTKPDWTTLLTTSVEGGSFCANTLPNCCPNKYECIGTIQTSCVENINACEIDGKEIEICSEYTNKDKCEKNSCGAGLVGSTEYNSNDCDKPIFNANGEAIAVTCGCKWADDPAVSGDEKCVFYKSYTDVFNPAATNYYCEHSDTQIGECTAGKRIVTWTGKIKKQDGTLATDMSLVPDEIEEECPASTQKTYRCGFETKLPFFGIVEAIIAIGVLALFYAIRNKRKIR